MFRILLSVAVLLGVLSPNEVQGQSGTYHIILDPKERTKLSTRINSPVKKINKRMGDSFKKGDLLIQLDDEIFTANFIKAKAILQQAKTDLDAKKSLFEDDAASLFELKEAEAQSAIAYAELVGARETLDETKVLAPYNGKVVSLYIEEYELPASGAELIEVIRDDILVAKFLASSKEELKLGMPLFITLNETGETLQAIITRISPEIDPSSGTIKVEAEIDNKNGKHLPGMSGVASFQQETRLDDGGSKESAQ